MFTTACFQLLSRRWREELVVCTLGTATSEWHALTQNDCAFHMHAMGIAGSFALGLALARPQSTVWLMDADGGLSMSLGALLTEAQHQPKNLVHFVVNNGTYQVIGGYPVVNADRTDYCGIAKAAGIRRCYRFNNVDDFGGTLDEILDAKEHSFVVLDVDSRPGPKAPIPFEGPEIKYRFARHMERQEGITVLGPYGY